MKKQNRELTDHELGQVAGGGVSDMLAIQQFELQVAIANAQAAADAAKGSAKRTEPTRADLASNCKC